MAISKFQIYDYWKDKAITNKFEIKTKSACTEGDDAIPITEFPDEIFCWACSGKELDALCIWLSDICQSYLYLR